MQEDDEIAIGKVNYIFSVGSKMLDCTKLILHMKIISSAGSSLGLFTLTERRLDEIFNLSIQNNEKLEGK